MPVARRRKEATGNGSASQNGTKPLPHPLKRKAASPAASGQTTSSRCWGVIKYLILFLCIPPFLNYAALHQEAKALEPPGAIYDIGFGQKLFFGCQGKGQPTVILDAPTGMSSDVWVLVQQELAKHTKVCVYDRAGIGFSERPHRNFTESGSSDDNEASSQNRWMAYTVERMADDLHRVVTYSSHQEKPFILVGSELGAMVARFYTQLYESDISDVVLIDPLVEDIFDHDTSIWSQFWFQHLVPYFQTVQLLSALGITRLALLLGLMEQPIVANNIPEEVIKRQKYLLCNPRHLSTAVDEHHFINDTISQMQTLFSMKPFPRNVSVTVITGNYYDEQLPSSLNKAWAKSQQHLISQLHPGCSHLVVNGADHRMLYKHPSAIVEPIRKLVKKFRSKLKLQAKMVQQE